MDDPRPHFSIWLPTFNRPAKLLQAVQAILPQLSTEVTCTIIDNNSDVPVEGLLRGHFGDAALVHLKVIRNGVNIGGNANICRCFELCQSEWVWILGDDDVICPDAISQALGFISNVADDVVYIGLDHPHLAHPRLCSTTDELASSARSLGALICLPMCLFRVGNLRPHLRYAYQWLSTCAPQLLFVLHAMHVDGRKAVLRAECLRVHEREAPFRGSGVLIAWCTATLCHVPLACVDSRPLRRLIPNMISPLELVYELRVGIRVGQFSPGQARRIFRAVAALKYPFWKRQFETIRFYMYISYDRLRSYRADLVGDISAYREDRT